MEAMFEVGLITVALGHCLQYDETYGFVMTIIWDWVWIDLNSIDR